MKIGGFDSDKFEVMSSGDFADYNGMVKVYYITGRVFECPIHGRRDYDGLYCKVCGKAMQYAVQEAFWGMGWIR